MVLINSFKQVLTEAAASEEKLTHLEHAEDHVINAGADGFNHAVRTLNAVHDKMQGKYSEASITTKYDGSPSIVFGKHPETGKFFVASKSAFNKNPKLNYTPEDVDKHHGDVPGLAVKLKAALQHLPKIMKGAKKGDVRQGDIMHSGVRSKDNPNGDIDLSGGMSSFKPNTLTYTVSDVNEDEKARRSKIGVAIHTAYEGKTFGSLKAKYNAGSSGLNEHPDVHVMDVSHSGDTSKLSKEDSNTFKHHIKEAEMHHNSLSTHKGGYDAIEKHADNLKTFINHTVRTDEYPTVSGFKAHLKGIYGDKADKLKTAEGKQRKIAEGKDAIKHVTENEQAFNHFFNMHQHLQSAKDTLIPTLASNPRYGHMINGEQAKPEGFVVSLDNRPTKLVHRAEFSRANFARQR